MSITTKILITMFIFILFLIGVIYSIYKVYTVLSRCVPVKKEPDNGDPLKQMIRRRYTLVEDDAWLALENDSNQVLTYYFAKMVKIGGKARITYRLKTPGDKSMAFVVVHSQPQSNKDIYLNNYAIYHVVEDDTK